jgi:hypothetical protein
LILFYMTTKEFYKLIGLVSLIVLPSISPAYSQTVPMDGIYSMVVTSLYADTLLAASQSFSWKASAIVSTSTKGVKVKNFRIIPNGIIADFAPYQTKAEVYLEINFNTLKCVAYGQEDRFNPDSRKYESNWKTVDSVRSFDGLTTKSLGFLDIGCVPPLTNHGTNVFVRTPFPFNFRPLIKGTFKFSAKSLEWKTGGPVYLDGNVYYTVSDVSENDNSYFDFSGYEPWRKNSGATQQDSWKLTWMKPVPAGYKWLPDQ